MKHLLKQSHHCSLTMVRHRVVKCVSGGKMCLATLSQIVTCSVKSPGSSFILNRWAGWDKGEVLIWGSLMGTWYCSARIQLCSLQWGKKWIELPSGPWGGTLGLSLPRFYEIKPFGDREVKCTALALFVHTPW